MFLRGSDQYLAASHHNYGQHLSKEEVEALVAPHPDALDAVDEWLEAHGIDLDQDVSRSPARDWVTVGHFHDVKRDDLMNS
jgi:hypothetical protein